MTSRLRGRTNWSPPIAAVALVVLGLSACRTSPETARSISVSRTFGSADAVGRERLRRDALQEAARDASVVRPDLWRELQDLLGQGADSNAVEGDDSIVDAPVRAIEAIARRRLDLAVAPTAAAPMAGRVSREATRLYLEGRLAMAASRPSDALGPLRDSYRLGGGPPALRALAEACDDAGRVVEGIEARRELARRGQLNPRDRRLLVEGLVRRRQADLAIAVQAAGVLISLEQDHVLIEAVRLAELLELAGIKTDATSLRAAIASLLEGDRAEDAWRLDGDGRRRFWVAAGDDAARAGQVLVAADRWRRADEGGSRDVSIRGRRLRAEAALGRDVVVQAVLLDAADAPTDGDLRLAASLRGAGVRFDRLAAILDASIDDDGALAGTWRILVAVDPVRGAAVLDRLAVEDRLAVAGPLVTAAFEGGAASALAVARTLEDAMSGVDAAVQALLSGPIPADELLIEALAADEISPGSVVIAELFRRHDRLDLAARVLAAAPETSSTARVARLRLAGDAADPGRIAAVPVHPFDTEVQRARVSALLAAGEPELAAEVVEALLEQSPGDAATLAVAARVASTRRDGALEAVELAAHARRAGDDSLTTTLDLAGFATALPDTEGLSASATRTLATLADDAAFRAILEADAALSSGDPATAIDRLEPRLSEHAGRDAVLVRLLAAWRAAGRLAEARLRLAALVERHPADPTLGDALFAVDRTLLGARAAAIELRAPAKSAVSGQPARRLELALAEIPESHDEWRSVTMRRLERRPAGDAVRIERLAMALEMPGPQLEEALEAAKAIDPDAIAPRQGRRLASVAAALPDRRGASMVDRIAASMTERGERLDVDTAIAVATTLDASSAAERLAASRPASPWTRVDPTWRERLAVLASRDLAAADLAATFSLTGPPADPDDAGRLRTATAIAMRAGHDAATILDRIDRAAGLGWRPSIAWPDGGPADGRRLGAIASDASMLGREDLAIELMELAIDDDPTDPVALNNLGYALLERGDLERAGALLEESRRLAPESASTLDSIGWLRFLKGRHDPADPESAVSLVRRSISIRLDEGRIPSAEVLMHLADATWAAGEQAEATRLWQSLAGREDDDTRRRRLAGIRNYQVEVWGGELVPSASIDRLLEGRWHEAARARLEAIAEGRPPLGLPADPAVAPLDA